MQQASGLDFEKYHCRRVGRMKSLLDNVVKNHAVFVEAPSACGKSSLAQLVMEYCKENNNFQCFFINALIDVTQEEGKQYSLSDFLSKKLPSLVIIDEVRLLFVPICFIFNSFYYYRCIHFIINNKNYGMESNLYYRNK